MRFSQRRTWAAGIAMGLLPSVVYILLWNRRPVGFYSDDALYILAAKSLLQGRYVALQMLHPIPLNDPLPGYPFLLAPLVWLLQPHWEWLKALNIILALLSMVMLWKISRRWLSAASSVMVTLIFALNPEFIRWVPTVMAEPAFIFFMLLSVVLLGKLLDGAPLRYAWGLGIVLGWLGVMRPQGLVFMIAAGAALFAVRRVDIAVRALPPALLMDGAVFLRNYLATHTATGYLTLWRSENFGSWTAIFDHARKLLTQALAGQFIPTEIMAPALSAILSPVIGVGVGLGVIVGILTLLRRTPQDRALALFMILGSCFYFLIHALWLAEETRYLLPLIPFIALFGTIGWSRLPHSPRLRLGAIGGGCLAGLYLAGIVSARHERMPLSAREPSQRLHRWITERTAASAFFLSANASEITLYTERPCIGALYVRDGDDFYHWLRWYHLSHIIVRPAAMVGLGTIDYKTRFWRAVEHWTAAAPQRYPLVYQDAAAHVFLYQVSDTPLDRERHESP